MNDKVAAGLRLLPMTVIMGTIFFLSHQPGDQLSLPALPGLDKLAHLAAYGVLAATVLFAFSDRQKRTRPRRVVLFTVFFCLFYGISDELHQSFIPHRDASILDILADTGGAALVGALWIKWGPKIAMNKLLRSH